MIIKPLCHLFYINVLCDWEHKLTIKQLPILILYMLERNIKSVQFFKFCNKIQMLWRFIPSTTQIVSILLALYWLWISIIDFSLDIDGKLTSPFLDILGYSTTIARTRLIFSYKRPLRLYLSTFWRSSEVLHWNLSTILLMVPHFHIVYDAIL